MKTLRDRFDMVVVGAGPAGEKAAAHAAYFGKRVVIVERADQLGGAVIHSGGVPTKTLRETALYVTGFRHRGIYGVSLKLDRARALDVLRERTSTVTALIERQVRTNLERHGIDLIHGTARLLGPGQVAVATAGGERVLEAPVVLLATGAHPVHPPGIPFDDPAVRDSDGIIGAIGDVETMIVLGAGAIGCEYASIFTALDVRVTLVGNADRLVPALDAEMSALLLESFGAMGMQFRLGTRAAGITHEHDHVVLTLSEGERLEADLLLVAAGRAGNTEGLGLEAAGVEVDRRGNVRVGADMQTTCPGIYAAGDLIGAPALASVAVEQGRRAASNAFGTPLYEGEHYQAPIGVYTVPEVAQIGLTEEECVAQGIDHVVGRARFASNARANISGSTEGMVKIICRRDDRRLIGVHILAEAAAELIHIGQVMMQHGGGIDYLIHVTFNVPTWSDAYKFAAFDALGQLEGGGRLQGPRQPQDSFDEGSPST